VAECKRLKVTVLLPDINKSESDFSIENKINIRFGLTAIKNVGAAAIKSILDARNNGKFKTFEDFCFRVNLGPVNKKTIESLIKAGAMDIFGNRANLLMRYPEIVERAHRKSKQEKEGQVSLFGDTDEIKIEYKPTTNDIDDFSDNEKLAFEKEYLGLYLTSHPQHDNLMHVKTLISHELELLLEEKEGTKIRIGGIIESLRKIFTKKNNSEMAFIVIANERGLSTECVIFPRVFEQYKDLLVQDSVIIIEGHLDTKNDRPSIIAEKISAVNKPL
jgi:DNA polymerase III subunit alpha